MNLFPETPDFKIGSVGFDGKDAKGRPLDLLDRKVLGRNLTDLVDRINQPLVIALDGEWGSGKSHFLKLWTGAHCLELGGSAKVVYFDAFEHDYLDDPLVSLVASLVDGETAKGLKSTALEKVKKAAFPLARLGLRLGAAALTAGVSEYVGATADAVLAKLGDTAEASIDKFWAVETGRIAAMRHFRSALEALTEAEGEEPQKIVFIVDELDRCRPDYALSLLETIKHFFTVPNVHFVLGANLSALENSVKARYGAEIDASKYIQKFISVSMRLPQDGSSGGNGKVAYSYLLAKVGRYSIGANTKEKAKEILQYVTLGQEVQLRDTDRILPLLALLPKDIDMLQWGYRTLVVGATIIRVLHPSVYAKVRSQRARMADLEPALSLVKPTRTTDSGPAMRDWMLWASITETKANILEMGVAPGSHEQALKGFGSFGDLPTPSEIRNLFAEAFDTFSLASE